MPGQHRIILAWDGVAEFYIRINSRPEMHSLESVIAGGKR
jgi:hypothetical protein